MQSPLGTGVICYHWQHQSITIYLDVLLLLGKVWWSRVLFQSQLHATFSSNKTTVRINPVRVMFFHLSHMKAFKNPDIRGIGVCLFFLKADCNVGCMELLWSSKEGTTIMYTRGFPSVCFHFVPGSVTYYFVIQCKWIMKSM